MRLYFKPGACSMSTRIVLIELGLAFDPVKVDTDAGLTHEVVDYRTINPKGYVPALELDDGSVLTENAAILQYLADANPHSNLAVAKTPFDRAQQQEWLSFASSELHKAFSPYFSGAPLEAEKELVDLKLARRIGDVERALSDGRKFILGGSFTVADAYLFVVLNWSGFIGLDLDRWPHVASYLKRLADRPAVQGALVQEGFMAGDNAA